MDRILHYTCGYCSTLFSRKQGRYLFPAKLYKKIKKQAAPWRCLSQDAVVLLFHDLQDLHGAGLDTDAAGDALGGGAVLGSDHDLHGADFHTLTAGGAELLVDHVNTGLGVLGNSTGFTDLSALAALDTDHGLSRAVLLYNLDAGQILMELLVKSGGASIDTLQASHALCTFFNNKLLHNKESPLLIIRYYYTGSYKK